MSACGRSPSNAAVNKKTSTHGSACKRSQDTRTRPHNNSTLPREDCVGGVSTQQRPYQKTPAGYVFVYDARIDCAGERGAHTTAVQLTCHQQGQQGRVVWHRRGHSACWRQPKATHEGHNQLISCPAKCSSQRPDREKDRPVCANNYRLCTTCGRVEGHEGWWPMQAGKRCQQIAHAAQVRLLFSVHDARQRQQQ